MKCMYYSKAMKIGVSMCYDEQPLPSYMICTRRKGHKGRHVACGTWHHSIHTWYNMPPLCQACTKPQHTQCKEWRQLAEHCALNEDDNDQL